MTVSALSIERVLTLTDGWAAPIRFSKSRFHGHDRILIRQANSWIVVPENDIESFIEGIDAALALTENDFEPGN